MDFFLQHSIFFGAMLCFVIVARNFAGRNVSLKTWFDAIVFFSGGVLLFYAWLSISGIFFNTVFLNHIYIPFIWFMGPGTYLGFYLVVDTEFRFRRRHWLYFAPGLGVLLALAALNLFEPALFEHRPPEFFFGRPAGILEYLFVLGFVQNMIYYLPIFRSTSLLFNFKALKTQAGARIMVGMYVVTTGITAMLIASFAIRDVFWLYFASALTAYLAVAVHIFRRFSPELFEQIQTAIDTGRVSRLEGLDLKQLHFELIELMTSEKLYMDENLTVARVADELDVRADQLSEFMSRHMQMNFKRFINQLRIEKAVKLLLDNPDANILDIAFECGFSSKAAFNAAFSSIKGMPPSRYLKNKRSQLR
jgi:AraC-like DNA-binding protein